MKATIIKPMIFKAAATLANGGYGVSVLYMERRGDEMVICGTNTYVAVYAKVEAEFSRWPDGEKVQFGGDEVRGIMRGVSKSLKNAAALTIEIAKGSAVVSLDVEGASVQVAVSYDKNAVKPVKDIDRILPERQQEAAPERGATDAGNVKVASYFNKLVANTICTISENKHSAWEMIGYGSKMPIEYASVAEPARVFVMPIAH